VEGSHISGPRLPGLSDTRDEGADLFRRGRHAFDFLARHRIPKALYHDPVRATAGRLRQIVDHDAAPLGFDAARLYNDHVDPQRPHLAPEAV
jgi:hypothetical protein